MSFSIFPIEKGIELSQVTQIVTHPGGAHRDDFFACCILVYLYQVPVERREPSQADLDDPCVLVVDVGLKHDPQRSNFDHHQFPADHPPVCALSLVLQHLGYYEDARNFCDWLEAAEYFDSRGPVETAAWLGVSQETLDKTVSPADITLLRRFASVRELRSDSWLWQMMQATGEDIVCYIRDLRTRLDFLDRHVEFWTIATGDESFEALFLPRSEPLPEEPGAGLERFVEQRGKGDRVIALVYPDRRGTGYGLSRYNNSSRMDFSMLEKHCDDVHFAHVRGFVCKTSASQTERLRELLKMAYQGEKHS